MSVEGEHLIKVIPELLSGDRKDAISLPRPEGAEGGAELRAMQWVAVHVNTLQTNHKLAWVRHCF